MMKKGVHTHFLKHYPEFQKTAKKSTLVSVYPFIPNFGTLLKTSRSQNALIKTS